MTAYQLVQRASPDEQARPAPRARAPRDLPWQEVSLDVLREKYAKGAERDLDGADAARAVRRRVARALAAVEADPAAHESARSSRRWRTASFPAGGSTRRRARGSATSR